MRTLISIVAPLCLAIGGCAGSTPDLPDVLLVTWDTVRADHVGIDATPTWNRLASRAVVLSEARTPAPTTLPAHASIMTGEKAADHILGRAPLARANDTPFFHPDRETAQR